MSHADEVANRLGRSQYGVFGRGQLLERGVTPAMIQTRVRSGAWSVLDSGVYALPSHPRGFHQRCMAAVIGQRDAVVGGLTAAALWKLGGIEQQGGIELVVPPGGNTRSRLAAVRRSCLIVRRSVDGIAVNSPELVVLHLADRLDDRRLARVLDDALLRGLCRLDHVGDWMCRTSTQRMPGRARVARILHERGDGYVPAASELEAALFDMLAVPGIPRVIRQPPFPWRPDLPNRLDGMLEGWPLIVEADGRAWHMRLEQQQIDRARDRAAHAHRLIPLRYTWIDLTERVDACRAEVLQLGPMWASIVGTR